MLRWNGYGEETVTYPLSESASIYFSQILGEAKPPLDVPRAAILIPPAQSLSHPHALLHFDDDIRLRHALGQSFPDLAAKRFGCFSRFPDAVAFPESDEDVVDLLAWARTVGVQLIPFGGGTSVVGGVNPMKKEDDDRPVVTISLARLNDLRALDETSQLATFGAGTLGPYVEAQLRAHNFMLGHYPQSFEHSSLGGWVAARSSGQQSLGYGRIESLFAGGIIETPSGRITLPPMPASAAGPDLRQLILGSEGRLGIITEATVRVRPIPQTEAFYGVMFPDWATGINATRQAIQSGIPLSMMRLSNPTETETFLNMPAHQRPVELLRSLLRWRSFTSENCLLLFGITGSQKMARSTRQMMADLTRQHHGLWLTEVIGNQWAKSRFRSAYLRDSLWEQGYGVDTLETAVTWDMVPQASQAILRALAAAVSPVLPMVHLSHFYRDGASLYFTFLFRVGATLEETMHCWQALKDAGSKAVMAVGGTISHQHGVGMDHRPYLVQEKSTLGVEVLKDVQSFLDPLGIMNPGKLM
jgi:alkyldihydroxyacetonephosphate synthase